MDALTLKRKWKDGQPSAGMWLRLTDPTVAEMVADLGYDWVLFDAEHGAYDLQTLQMMFIAMRRSETAPLVRVPANDPVFIKRVLDCGAAGVLVPQLVSAAEAQAAVAACKYPPDGIRGAGPRRPSDYWQHMREYIASANEHTIAWVMLETRAAVEDIDAILAVPGLDGVIVGPADLANSFGLYADSRQPVVQAAIRTIIEKARAAGTPFGSGNPGDDHFDWMRQGATLIGLADDEMFLRDGATAALEAFKRHAS